MLAALRFPRKSRKVSRMLNVPLSAVPNQQVQVQLNNQACTIVVQQLAYGLILSLYVGTSLIITSALCENLNRLVRNAYLGFIGDLVFSDTQGASDPIYTGLGNSNSRYQLVYLTPDDIASFGLSE